MSTNTIEKKIAELKELEEMANEIKNEIETIKDELKKCSCRTRHRRTCNRYTYYKIYNRSFSAFRQYTPKGQITRNLYRILKASNK